MKTNTRVSRKATTHGGGTGLKDSNLVELRKTVVNCLLFEKQFYESGLALASRISTLVPKVPLDEVVSLADYTRNKLGLRGVALYTMASAATVSSGDGLVSEGIYRVVSRADELAEFLTLYWKLNGKRTPLSAQVKKGLARAFGKFDAYQFGKYNRDGAIKLRDVMFLVHPKPETPEQVKLYSQIATGTVPTPDTWETALSAGKDKQATWLRLLGEKKLGTLAFLRNLRNMHQAGLSYAQIETAMAGMKWEKSRILPFQFITAAKQNPDLEEAISSALIQSSSAGPTIPGRTLIVVDVSGSMGGMMSGKGSANRLDAAAALAIGLREAAQSATLYATAGNDGTRVHKTKKYAARRGFALGGSLADGFASLGGGGIFLRQCMDYIDGQETEKFDRVVVITDEQDCDTNPALSMTTAKKLGTHNYIVNVGGYEVGLGEGAGWTKIHGFSERVPDWIIENEGCVVEAA
jgi:hypothetical protein